jgi:DNA-binding transcriptional MerR regulator
MRTAYSQRMATDDIMERLLDAMDDDVLDSAVDALHALLDDATIELGAPPMSVTDTAALVRLSPHTLRYYEQEDLVRPARNASGYREYSAFDLRRLVFLTRMRMSGMTMRDLKRYIALVEQGPATEAQRRDIMLAQRDRIRRQLRELTLSLEATEYKLRTYGGHPEP